MDTPAPAPAPASENKTIRVESPEQLIGQTESDWKQFRALYPKLLEEFSRRHCERVRGILARTGITDDERRHILFDEIRETDKLVASCFDNPRRSQLMIMVHSLIWQGLLTEEHAPLFSEGFRNFLKFHLEERRDASESRRQRALHPLTYQGNRRNR